MSDSSKRTVPWLGQILVGIQLAVYGAIAWLSPHFDFHSDERERPLILVVSLLLINFALHIWSLAILLKVPDSRKLGWRIVVVALVMRLILIGSTPIQEVDIYRYIWDGYVMTQGISPFRYTPLEIVDQDKPTSASEVIRLRSLVAQEAGIREALQRVHFSELPTVYPPTSQFVFAGAAMVTPRNSTVETRLLIMKSWIVAFDVAALGLIWLLLRLFEKHSAWLIAWGWSPLVLKEFANSGHLDSIAVFFTLAATCLLARVAIVENPAGQQCFANSRCAITRPLWFVSVMAIGLLMGLAVASKLYPVVILPLWIVAYSARVGWLKGLCLAAAAVLASLILLLPMVEHEIPASKQVRGTSASAFEHGSLHGLSTFLTRWEMNDLLFMIVEENIRPVSHLPDQPALWFAMVPDVWRLGLARQLATWSGQPEDRIPFLATRAIMAAIFAALLQWLALRSWREPQQLPQLIFLALAWFWFLSPTQNPWYWCWALAFVPFSNSRIWLAVSGMSLLYYFRFWFSYHLSNQEVLGTPFRGTGFFDFVVVWLEFGPFLLFLGASSILYSLNSPKLAEKRDADS